MKKIFILTLFFLAISIFLIIYLKEQKIMIEIKTQDVLKEYTYNSVGKIDPVFEFESFKDDFVEKINVTLFEEVSVGDELIRFESKEEEHELAVAKSEYALALLKEGEAIQKEKALALEVAENNLKKTVLTSPVDGYVVELYAKENTFFPIGKTLLSIIPKDFKVLIRIPSEIEDEVSDFENLEINFPRINKTFNLDIFEMYTKDSLYYISVDDEALTGERLLAEEIVRLKCIERIASVVWIPKGFLVNGTVETENGLSVPVEIIRESDDLVLVKGLEGAKRIFGKR